MKKTRATILALIAALAVTGITTSNTWAQADEIEPPEIRVGGKQDGRVLRYGILFITIAVVVGATLIPSKRGHQD